MKVYPFDEGKYPSPGSLASTVALARSELKALRSDITLTIPKAWAVVRTVELPITVKENLVNVVSYELDRLTPFSSDSALYDYRIIGEEDGKLRIMLVAAKADLIDPYLQAFREKGITVERLTVALSAMATLSGFVHSPESALFLKISAEGYEGGQVLGGALSSTFGGRFDGDDRPSNVRTVIEEISQRLDAIRKDEKKALLILSASEADYAIELKSRMTSVVDMLQGVRWPTRALPTQRANFSPCRWRYAGVAMAPGKRVQPPQKRFSRKTKHPSGVHRLSAARAYDHRGSLPHRPASDRTERGSRRSTAASGPYA